MKKILSSVLAIAAVSLTACSVKVEVNDSAYGTLVFDEMVLDMETIDATKATTSISDNYSISIYDTDETLIKETTYGAVLGADSKITLPSGSYRLDVRSAKGDVPASAIGLPIYGASKEFEITAGSTTNLGTLTCTLLQAMVSVYYSDSFLQSVTGDGSATVAVAPEYPLVFPVTYNSGSVSYDRSIGYFAVNKEGKTTMEVKFKGNVDGKDQTMKTTFTDIKARSWYQITFTKKVNLDGTASFEIALLDYIEDQELVSDVLGKESIIGEDPDKPKGDGGIVIDFDYQAGCDAEFDDLQNIVFPIISSTDAPTVHLWLKAVVPGGVKKFTVDISSDNDPFMLAVDAAEARHLDLINYTANNEVIFEVVPFPHGSSLYGQTELSFDLSTAQPALMIGPYWGTHVFDMNVTDLNGCSKTVQVKMVIKE